MKLNPIILTLAMCAAPFITFSQTVVFSDSWADAGLTDGDDPSDIAWYTTTSSNALEVTAGSMGLVTGTSGRGAHALYPAQDLSVGDTITLTLTLQTPATIGAGKSNAFRVGLFNSLGRSELNSNQTLSSSNPNPLFDGLPGYMGIMDIVTGTDNIDIRKHDVTATLGRFMSTTNEFVSMDSGGDGYSFAASTDYVVVHAITRSGEDELTISTTLSSGESVLSTLTVTDSGGVPTTFDMLGLQVNSNTFGSSGDPNTEDNGLTFTNIMLEVSGGSSSTTWADYDIIDGWVDTGDFLGWLYVGSDPWIISSALGGGWIYLPEDFVSETGSWAYLPK